VPAYPGCPGKEAIKWVFVVVVVLHLLIAFLFMAALRSRCGHYIFALWFLLSSFFLFFLA